MIITRPGGYESRKDIKMKIWRSVQQVHAPEGIDYRIDLQIFEDGHWIQCYVTQADYDGSSDGTEAVVVWGKHESTIYKMGYTSVKDALRQLNRRKNPEHAFRLVQGA